MRLRGVVFAAAIAIAALGATRPVLAADRLDVVSGSTIGGAFEVLGLVAERAGFYAQERLDVVTQYAGNAAIAAQLVAAGKADVCSVNIGPLLAGYEKGLRLTAFFSRDPHYLSVLAVLADSPIRTLADFKGATLGEYSVGSAAEIAANSELSGAGVARSDYTYIPIGSGAQAISAITSGKVAGVAFPYPELAQYQVVAGLKFRYFWHPILADIPNDAYAATPATIAAKGDVLVRFARASIKAGILIRENPRLAARYFLEGTGAPVTADALQRETRLLVLLRGHLPAADPYSRTIGELSPLNMDVFTRWSAANGLTAHVVPVAAVSTDRFIPAANAFDRRAFIKAIAKR
jgi:NitT/TauT family transport system substrate-binding protein